MQKVQAYSDIAMVKDSWFGQSNINLGSMVSGRNPFRMHEDLVNYNLDSEDEWAEENGEDLLDADCQKLSDDDEDDLAENEEAEGFIVEDDYLSVSELNYSEVSKQDEQHIQEEL